MKGNSQIVGKINFGTKNFYDQNLLFMFFSFGLSKF